MVTAVISGAGSGIGEATAKLYDEKKIATVLIGRDEKKLSAVSKSLKHCKAYIPLDLTSTFQSITSVLDSHLKSTSVQILINNAGIYAPKSIAGDDDEVWLKHFQSNLMSAVKLTRYFWPKFVNQNKGHIVNISSTLGLRPIPNTSAYSSIKAAMNNWTQSLALEGAAFNIRANAICPGVVDTPIQGFHGKNDPGTLELKQKLKSIQPLHKLAQPQDIAGVITSLTDESCSWLTGTIIPVDGGIMLTSKDI